MEYTDKELYDLIPQRPPIVMVDRLCDPSETSAKTGLTVLPDNLFIKDGVLREAGIIEHIAQSAAAMAGYETKSKGLAPRLGYIGEIKKCRIHQLPTIGSQLHTQIHILGEAGSIRLLEAETRIGDTLIAECQMKIFIKDC